MVASNRSWQPWTWDFRVPLDRSAKYGPISLRSKREQAERSVKVVLGDRFRIGHQRLAFEGV